MLPAFRRTIPKAIAVILGLGLSVSLLAQGLHEASASSLPDAPDAYGLPLVPPQEPAPPAQSEADKKRLQEEEAAKVLHQEEQQHVLGVVPYFNIVNGTNAPPLNPKQKFELAFKSATNPFAFLGSAFVAGINQAEDSFPGYGQGAEGYAKRLGAGYADSFDGTMLGNAVFPVLLHQDPRYYRMGTGSFKKRFWYSVSTAFRTRGDNGKWQPGYSNLLGNLAAGGISNLYYPASDRGAGLTFERAFVVTGEGTVGGLFAEFIPDIQKLVFRKKAAASASTSQP